MAWRVFCYGILGFVFAQIDYAGDVNFLAFDNDQSQVTQFVQDARKMLLSEIEAGCDCTFVGEQG